MSQVIHQNFYDKDGKVYCKRLHKIMVPDSDTCSSCDYCVGSLQGNGIECYWEDNTELPIVSPENPESEMLRVSKLIDSGVLKKG